MTGDQFLAALNTAIAPATVVTINNNTTDRNGGIDFTLSDGRKLTVLRKRVKDASTAEELDAYAQSLIR